MKTTELNAIDAMPTYAEIEDGLIAYLDGLRSYGLEM